METNRFGQAVSRPGKRDRAAGFTLLEVLLVLAVIGILGIIGLPSWINFFGGRQVVQARNEVYQAIRSAQAHAIAERAYWRFGLREQSDRLEWAIYAEIQDAATIQWHSLDPSIRLNPDDTTLAHSGGVYYVRFDYLGNVRYRLSTVTFESENGNVTNRCVVISTLLGAMRKGTEQPYPNSNGRYCY